MTSLVTFLRLPIKTTLIYRLDSQITEDSRKHFDRLTERFNVHPTLESGKHQELLRHFHTFTNNHDYNNNEVSCTVKRPSLFLH